MDFRRENGYSSGNVVQVLSGNGVNQNWGSFANDQAMWATEDDYGNWNREASIETNPNSNYDGKLSGSEPPNRRSRNVQTGELQSSNKSKVIGKMFYKTKLCCKFRVGTCPYVTNCNFAHSLEELRKPPPNWQDVVAAHEEDQGVSSERREEYQIPILGVSEEAQRNYKGRHCKKFFTEEGCPYGESCSFLHDEQSKTRESVAISLGPGSGGNYGGNAENGSILKPSNWKTRICNKWELTGYCPFGSKCHFAHGAAELHQFGGQLDGVGNDSLTSDRKQGVLPAKTSVDAVLSSVPYNPNSDNYNMGPSQRLSIQRTGRGPNQKWKGPDKISKIYGDWIDDL